MYTTDLIRYLARTHGRSQEHYRQALADIIDGITTQLTDGHRVQLIGFGSFYTREQPAGTVRSVQTGRTLAVPARRVAAFRAGEFVKQAVRQRPVDRPPKGIASSVTSALGSLLQGRAPTSRTR
jgi:DNA-binding protein HU-beta